jgi:hypothetical protein
MFAVAKPSGPTSMSVVNDIKRLVNNSRLFVDPAKFGQKETGKRGKRTRDVVKIGQGGTLDPLADGVLGEDDIRWPGCHSISPTHVRLSESSHRDRQRNKKAGRLSGLRQSGILQMEYVCSS